jgi:hypothetical protein
MASGIESGSTPHGQEDSKEQEIQRLKEEIKKSREDILSPGSGLVSDLINGFRGDSSLQELSHRIGKKEAQHWYWSEVCGYNAEKIRELEEAEKAN